MKTKPRFLTLAGMAALLAGCTSTYQQDAIDQQISLKQNHGIDVKEYYDERAAIEEHGKKCDKRNETIMNALGDAQQRNEDGESYDHWKKRLAQDKEDKKKALLKNNLNNTPALPRNVSMPACPH